jgi:hypothetical protein
LFTGTPISSTNKTESHDITEILLEVALHPHIITPLKRDILVIELTNVLPETFMINWL